ncbi:hypothetical protein BR93DRAFT_961276 [Coniochaeta sp. PMI_546]|nr:hypothetical protein BR93DRAFT_961276 [Coniochaeta sp. PMI_546]
MSPATLDGSPQRDDKVTFVGEMRDGAPITLEILFPDLQEIITYLVTGLGEQRYPGLEIVDYPTWIENAGGVTSVVATLLAAIDHRVMALSNQKLSPKLLDDIFTSQSEDREPWPDSAGYADYVTDSRDSL